jgi:nucleoside phosphorylase
MSSNPAVDRTPLDLSHWADIVIICAKDVEYAALKTVLSLRQTSTSHVPQLTLKHFIVDKRNRYRILVAQLPSPGAGNVVSGIIASKLTKTYSPWLIISFGIAGRLDSDIQFDDVIFTSGVQYLDLRKDLGSKGTVTKQLPLIQTNETLLQTLRSLPNQQERDGKNFSIHEVLLVSSEAVVRSEDAVLRERVKDNLTDAAAVEMEAFGVYLACSKFLHNDGRGPLPIAVKGITDPANATKDDSHNDPASLNAATWINALLDCDDFEKLGAQLAFTTWPSVQSRRRCNYTEAKIDMMRFVEAVRPALELNHQVERGALGVQLAAAHMMTAKLPRVFYHWRLTGHGIHWLEFCFLRIFRVLADSGYPVTCFVTDKISEMPHQQLRSPAELEAARNRVAELVPSILGNHSSSDQSLVWFSSISRLEHGLNEFVRSSGFDYEALEDIMSERPQARKTPRSMAQDPRLNHEFDLWFKWIAWICRHDGAGVVFSRPDTRIYEFLRLFRPFQPVIVPTKRFKLKGRSGKLQSPGSLLYLDPPEHPKIIEWISNESEPEPLLEFLLHLSDFPLPSKSTASWKSNCDELRKAIVEELRKIDEVWFRSVN